MGQLLALHSLVAFVNRRELERQLGVVTETEQRTSSLEEYETVAAAAKHLSRQRSVRQFARGPRMNGASPSREERTHSAPQSESQPQPQPTTSRSARCRTPNGGYAPHRRPRIIAVHIRSPVANLGSVFLVPTCLRQASRIRSVPGPPACFPFHSSFVVVASPPFPRFRFESDAMRPPVSQSRLDPFFASTVDPELFVGRCFYAYGTRLERSRKTSNLEGKKHSTRPTARRPTCIYSQTLLLRYAQIGIRIRYSSLDFSIFSD